jgi:hypothetical protein
MYAHWGNVERQDVPKSVAGFPAGSTKGQHHKTHFPFVMETSL